MRTFARAVTCLTFAFLVPIYPAVGDEIAPARTPWKATDPNGEKVVRWVFEGCAAYPVTETAPPDGLAASDEAQTAVDLTADPKLPNKSN